MIETDNYRRFERVDNVEETATGLLGQTHGELMRIDLVREDVVRVKISRGGVVRRGAHPRRLRRPVGGGP